jgi:anhydro-N-acetylmuramic acid kinase
MSGTSADGIDAALVRLADSEHGVRADVVAHQTLPHSRSLSDRILAAALANAREIAELHVLLGRRFGEAALKVVAAAKRSPEEIDFVGSHGQTIVHLPPNSGHAGATMQIGCPATIAEKTGRPVVSDFRSRDMALLGHGAPLVPIVDHLLFSKRGENRLLLNIGGIANFTATNGIEDDVLAFDTGPGNALLDALVRLLTGGQQRYDTNGEIASKGKPNEPILRDLLAHPFIAAPFPKSADRDTFGEPLARRLMAENAELPPEDLIATAAAFTAESILLGIAALPSPYRRIDRIVASGGGVYNQAVMARLRAGSPAPVLETTAEHGVHPDAKEAVAFAVLARQTMLGRTSSLPKVTGASKPAILGSITL